MSHHQLLNLKILEAKVTFRAPRCHITVLRKSTGTFLRTKESTAVEGKTYRWDEETLALPVDSNHEKIIIRLMSGGTCMGEETFTIDEICPPRGVYRNWYTISKSIDILMETKKT